MNPENSNPPFGTGAVVSPKDPRTIKLDDAIAFGGAPLTKGGTEYTADEINHQHNVGICTAIMLTQNREKALGKKFSADFHYLLQKKFYDVNAPIGWREGSSIFHALKVGKAYGFLQTKYWTHTTEADRYLPYDQYIAKLRDIPDEEVNRLIAKCTDKLPGYASVDVNDPQAIARAINESEAGILCMYISGSTWWIPSWLPKDINPLRKPVTSLSGHAIVMSRFDYTNAPMQRLANTWGAEWCDKGCADINYSEYSMREAWSILRATPVIPPYEFKHNLWFGKKDDDNIELQRRLGVSPTDRNFGPKTLGAVIKYQWEHGIVPAVGFVGPITRASLNQNG